MIKLSNYRNEEEILVDIKKLFFKKNTKDFKVKEQFKNIELIKKIECSLNELGIKKDDFKNKKDTLIECIIVAKYKELELIKNKIDKYGTNILKDTVWNEYKNKCDELIKRKINIKLLNNLDIKTCPYCNENYITIRNNNTSFQLDHFFPKSKYPIFALSLYNLIPSCYACNHSKMNNLIGLSPFNEEIDFDKIKVSIIPEDFYFFLNEELFNIVIYSEKDKDNKLLKSNKDTLGLTSAYNFHKDYAIDLIKKAILYNNDTLNSIMSTYSNLFKDRDEIIRIVYSNYHTVENLNKRPLSKMTMDLLEEFGIK